jgi:N-carbamoylputrescine amidase
VLVQAPRDQEAVLVADLDLAQRRDWLELFRFPLTRRPGTYADLTRPVLVDEPYGAGHAATAVVK